MIWRILLLGTAAFILHGCTLLWVAREPVSLYFDPGNSSDFGETWVFLPGLGDRPDQFVTNQFFREVRQRDLPINLVAVDMHFKYYKNRSFLTRLHDDVIEALLSQNQKITLVGISLGGFGAMYYSSYYPDQVSRTIAIAPYAGPAEFLNQIDTNKNNFVERYIAGGEECAQDKQHLCAMWRWIYRDSSVKDLWLAYGRFDGRAVGSKIVHRYVPSSKVVVVDGGHKWKAWRSAWPLILDQIELFK